VNTNRDELIGHFFELGVKQLGNAMELGDVRVRVRGGRRETLEHDHVEEEVNFLQLVADNSEEPRNGSPKSMKMLPLQHLHANRWFHVSDIIVSNIGGSSKVAGSFDCIFGVYDVQGAV
jgi:hypothetical protein